MSRQIDRRTFMAGLGAAAAAAGLPSTSAVAQTPAPNAAPVAPMETVTVTPDLVAAAKREGAVMVRYAAPVEVMTPVAQAFTREFGISVRLDRKAGSLGNQLFATESRAGRHIMDVAWITDPLGLKRLGDEGFYLRWTPANLPSLLPPGTYMEGLGYCPFWTDIIIPYNPDVVPPRKAREIFKTWHGFLDPDLAGRIGLVDPAATNAAFVTYMMFFELPQYGRGFFERIGAQRPRLYRGTAGGRDDLASGAIATFVPAQEFGAFHQFLQGDKTAWAYPDIAPSLAINHISISQNAPNAAAARLFAAWVFTDAGARAMQDAQTRPTIIGVPERRSAVAQLEKTDWWQPRPTDASWVPNFDHWNNAYPTLMPEMRRMLGWRG